ncbi:MAG: type II secretion system protein [Candidatus Moranbacteria bacterium]|nr:type II secretion system protein [Candidatus Moranbacteria bacterium]
MRKKRKRTEAGFTLIEIMITTALIAIVTTASLASLVPFKARRAVEGGERVVAAALRQAQNDAVTGKNISSCSSIPCVPFQSGAVNLPDGVVLSASQAVAFRVPQGEPINSGGVELVSGSVDFSLTKGGVTAHVCVYPLGRVEERPIGSGC